MKHELAFNLIGKLLQWSDAEFANEFRELQLMITHKYDGYHGFQPATRFHVALLNWLGQFASVEERQTAYRFVKDRLVYVSQREIHHLVGLLMPIVESLQRQRVAAELSIALFRADLEPGAIARRELMSQRTLYVGLSDGARIDVFRRYNEGQVSNEQVVAFSEISAEKWSDLNNELQKRLAAAGRCEDAVCFEVVCLVDDFTGSGSSLIRLEDGGWKGKVPKFCRANKERLGHQLASRCLVHVHHHLASAQARSQIDADLERFASEHPAWEFKATFSYVLPADIVIGDDDGDARLVALLKSWYDAGIEDEHTKTDIWFGYKRCGLPLVLEHNTPNNSVALLWATSKEQATPRMQPLFARRKRHSSHG